MSDHRNQVKRGVIIFIVDWKLKLKLPKYLRRELIFIKDILMGNEYHNKKRFHK